MGILCMALAVNAQQFGHITSEQLLQAMPEYDSAQAQLQELRQQYDLEIERIQVEINKKIEEFNRAEATMSNLIREAKASEIQEMQVRLQNFAQTAQQDLQQKRMEIFTPVQEKALNAVNEVAEENGFTYIFDTGMGALVYTSPDSQDILPLVKTKLGLP